MDRETIVKALHATTVADDQKEAGEYLDKRPRLRTTTSSESSEWQNLSHLLCENDDSPSPDEPEEDRRRRIEHLMKRWKAAARRARRLLNDPWSAFRIDQLPTARAKRSRYSSIRQTWTDDFIEVKIHPEPFARGAMRECYRLKKLSSLCHTEDWSHAHNYVAKRYIQEVDKQVILDDVMLQMDAKLWAEEFNRYDPPKKIDIMQMCVIQILDMPGQPLFHLEHFIEGDYIKYNSNSGFISEVARKTPHAFTHFTFERSGHQLMVVDVQGVGDLYTDPQIHTAAGTEYGDGNLGTRGMALFFHSHVCNDICHSLCLTDFDLSDSERRAIQEGKIENQTAATTFIHHASACSPIVPELAEKDAMECLRQRTLTFRSRSGSTATSRSGTPTHDDACDCEDCLTQLTLNIPLRDYDDDVDGGFLAPPRKVAFHSPSTESKRFDSMSLSSIGSCSAGGSSRLTRDTEREEYWNIARKQSIPAGVISVLEQQKLTEAHRVTQHASILGQIHLDLARYHELGRFLLQEENVEKKIALGETINHDNTDREMVKYDKEAALYHLDVARRCGVLEAILTIAQMSYGLPHELLKDIGEDENWNEKWDSEEYDKEAYAFELMLTAAEMGDRSAMLFVADAYETGRGMGKHAQPNFALSVEWYQKVLGFSDDENTEGSYRPSYEILAKMAEMYQEGGCELEQDFERAYNLYTEAAEAATEAMKGKLAAKYYEKLSDNDGFAPELLQVACEATYPAAVRQAAVIYFKNSIVKYWEVDNDDDKNAEDQEQTKKHTISQRDRQLILDNILEAVCVAGDNTRPHLCVAAQSIMRTEFPNNWPGLVPAIKVKLNTPDGNALLGSLLVLYRMAKIYEYKRTKERAPLVETMKELLPVLQHHFAQLENNPSQESVTIQKLILKIFHALIQFTLNLEMMTTGVDCWIEFCKNVLSRPCPPEINQIEDHEERTHMIWWKCKKWAAKILDRVFERYGAPGSVEHQYTDFANHFLQNYSIPCVEVMTHILNEHQRGTFVSERVVYLALSFLNTAVSHSHTWKVLKPHSQDMVQHILFPLLCHTDDDEEMWEDDAEEYVRFKYDIFEDMHNPAYGAGSLLAALSKRKDIIQPILAYAVNVLSTTKNPREVDGALRMLGELAAHLIKSKKYKKDVEKLVDAHVINRLTDEARFVRARAAWTLKQYSGAQYNNKKILKKAVETLIKTLCNDQEELPGCVESALALQCMLEDQEKAHGMIQPHIREIILKVLSLVARSQIEDVVAVMDDLMEQFMEDVIPIAADITDQLSNMFLQIMTSEVAEDRTPAMMSIISTLSTILEVVCEHREIMVKMEVSVLRIIDHVFTTANIDFYDEVFLLIQSLIMNYVSEPMWKVFDMLYHIVKNDNSCTIVFSDVVPVLHLYVVTDTESFLARPERLNAIIDMCKTVLHNMDAGDDDQLHAAKLLEILLLQCHGMINEAVPAIVLLALERLTKPFEDGIKELQHMLLLIVVAALYTNPELSIHVLKELAPGHPNPLDYITEQLLAMGAKIEGIHNRRMAVLAWCTLLQLPSEFRPSIVSYDPKKIVQNSLQIFHGLQRALKTQAENKKADEDDSDDSSDDEDDHRNIDDDLSDNEDHVDETTQHYLETLDKEHKKTAEGEVGDSSDDGEDSSIFEDETDTEQFATLMDGETGPDVFVIFKTTLRNFQQTDGMLFEQMIGTLSEEEKNQLHELDQLCDNHIKAEESKKLKESGGFAFGDAVLPGNFNFGG